MTQIQIKSRSKLRRAARWLYDNTVGRVVGAILGLDV